MSLHPAQSGHSWNDLARSVRCRPRRRLCPAAGVRPRRVPRRLLGLGLLRASPGVGALIAAVILAHYPPRRFVGRIMFGAVAIYGIAIIIFALSTSLLLSMALLAVLGFSDMISVVIRMTLIQLETPDDMRGRVSAVNSLFVIASNSARRFPRRADGGVARHHPGGDGRRRRRASGGAARAKGFRGTLPRRELSIPRGAEFSQYRKPSYSITSSTMESRPEGKARPSVFAVFMLITSSNFVACTTGKSAGFSPLRTRPT